MNETRGHRAAVRARVRAAERTRNPKTSTSSFFVKRVLRDRFHWQRSPSRPTAGDGTVSSARRTMRAARVFVLATALALGCSSALADTPWNAEEILALCDGTDDGLPCERHVDPRSYIPCRDQRCHKPNQEFRSANACGRPRPARNKVPTPEWTDESLDRWRAKQRGARNGGERDKRGKVHDGREL